MAKKKLKESFTKFGEGFRKVAMATATHPTTFGMLIVAMARTAQSINFALNYRKKTDKMGVRAQFFNNRIDDLANVTQNLALASAVAPVAVGALNLVQTAVAAKKKGKLE